MLRATLVISDSDHHLLLVTIHHIVADGWSIEVFMRELQALVRRLPRRHGFAARATAHSLQATSPLGSAT